MLELSQKKSSNSQSSAVKKARINTNDKVIQIGYYFASFKGVEVTKKQLDGIINQLVLSGYKVINEG